MLAEGETAALQFSGGKDSTALLYLARPYLDRITVLFGDTGAVYPHVREHVERTCEKLGATLCIVCPPESVHGYTERVGLPADIVPVEASDLVPVNGGVRLQPYTRCCAAMIWLPMQDAICELGVNVVLRGSKACDARVGVSDGHVEDGITYRSPLWHWSDADVMAYLKRQGADLPKHYPEVPDSFDCWICSAHLPHHGAAKLRWTREHYPEFYAITADRIRKVRETLISHGQRLAEAMQEVSR